MHETASHKEKGPGEALVDGRIVGWSFAARDFGWDIGEPGHNFTFVNPPDWQQAVTGSVLSHMSKHGPMILLGRGPLPEPVVRYLEKVRPIWASPADQLVKHGWILGGLDTVPWSTQLEIDYLLELE